MAAFMIVFLRASLTALRAGKAFGQLTDKTRTPTPNAGINQSFADESNAGLANHGPGDTSSGPPVTRALKSTGISFGSITANPNVTLDYNEVEQERK